MSSEDKQEALFNKWLSAEGVTFASPEAASAYRARVTRIKNAVQMKRLPDRVPAIILPSFFPAHHAGITPREAMYEYSKVAAAYSRFLMDFQPDAHIGADMPGPGKFFDILDYKLYSWPGHGVAPEQSYQTNEGEYMKADEYDALIHDPSNFMSNIYFPAYLRRLGCIQDAPHAHWHP